MTNWRAQVAEETACEAAAYGRQARREGNSIDSCAEYGDGFCDEHHFREAWRGQDNWIKTGGFEDIKRRVAEKRAAKALADRFNMLTGEAAE